MANRPPLPLNPEFPNAETYVDSLLTFVTSDELFQRLCGGVHILDFLTKEPDLYSSILPQEWRDWFSSHHISDILDLLMREQLNQFEQNTPIHEESSTGSSVSNKQVNEKSNTWRGRPFPPVSLLEYIKKIRKHSLDRTFKINDIVGVGETSSKNIKLTRNLSVGMKPKKIHEVENFAKYIDNLSSNIALTSPHRITHFVDFGSGQNYLGRALASPSYSHHVVAIESKQINIDGAKNMDVLAKLSRREAVMRNKKDYRLQKLEGKNTLKLPLNAPSSPDVSNKPLPILQLLSPTGSIRTIVNKEEIQYIKYSIQNGDISSVIDQIHARGANKQLKLNTFTDLGPPREDTTSLELMIISLHSCGNLVHHGLRSLILNPSVKAVAMVGCCYNLITERLGLPTYKLSNFRSPTLRLDRTSSACDPQGFPMSERFSTFRYGSEEGVRFNITARMMAVQAPQNWTSTDCDAFFTRHFYRALLQRIFLDRGIVGKPVEAEEYTVGGSPRGRTGAGEPILLGSLRKPCYDSFIAYVRGALAKLGNETERGQQFDNCTANITDEQILKYEDTYKDKKKELSIAWSLMAFSAGVVESLIVVDRWLYLKEQTEVRDCWVEAVFEYKQSPRNLVIVGVKA